MLRQKETITRREIVKELKKQMHGAKRDHAEKMFIVFDETAHELLTDNPRIEKDILQDLVNKLMYDECFCMFDEILRTLLSKKSDLNSENIGAEVTAEIVKYINDKVETPYKRITNIPMYKYDYGNGIDAEMD